MCVFGGVYEGVRKCVMHRWTMAMWIPGISEFVMLEPGLLGPHVRFVCLLASTPPSSLGLTNTSPLELIVMASPKDEYHISVICGLKKIIQMNLFTNQKHTHRHRKQTLVSKGEVREE